MLPAQRRALPAVGKQHILIAKDVQGDVGRIPVVAVEDEMFGFRFGLHNLQKVR